MIKYFKKFFSKYKSSPTDTNNSIIFSINNNKEIIIQINLNSFSAESATKFGYLLFLINEGYCVKHILDSLSIMQKENIDKNLFIQSAITQWSSQILDHDNNEEPIVKPTQFNIKD
jgi:hypothetical protein